ncbi:hypothetical protein Tco_1047834 [Tanacetum coccineum]
MFSCTIRSLSIQYKPAVSTLFATSNTLKGKVSPAIGSVRFQQATAGKEEPDRDMDKNKEAEEAQKKGDVMSHSFGEGYATRSDEEGFGGIYGGNQSLSREDADKVVHGNSPVARKRGQGEGKRSKPDLGQLLNAGLVTHPDANMAFDLRPTKDVLSWPDGANIAFDLVPDLQCLLRTWCEYSIRLSIGLATPLTYVLYREILTWHARR